MRSVLADTPADLADAVATLDAAGPLPARVVLVRSERHAHALRRALARAGRGALLAGTAFLTPLGAAAEVLRAAGLAFSAGEEALRPSRLLALFGAEAGLRLERFDLAVLRGTRGWEGAFATAIGELEAAALRPADLPSGRADARDLAAIWIRLDAEAGRSFTGARLLLEAAALLDAGEGAWPFDGPTLAAVSGDEDAALARFLGAIPRLTLAVATARPVAERRTARLAALFGPGASAAAAAARVPTPAATERELLSRRLFAEGTALARRPPGPGRDGTVDLEVHAGVEAEVAAAAAWVCRQVLEARLPLEEIAVLVPAWGPLALLVADRLAALPFGDGAFPVHVEGGAPAAASAAGARVLAVLRALEAHLEAEALAAVLPALRIVRPQGDPAPAHLDHTDSTALAFGLGTAGGNAASPEGALSWSARATAREADLAAALERARVGGEAAAREARQVERQLAALRDVRPALDALVGVARIVVGGAPLASIWDALRGFLARWVLLPGDGASLPARLDEVLAPACAAAPGRLLTGASALGAVRDALLALRTARGRFGEPAVYVGTVAGAAGLEFSAVRIVGLQEGALPRPPREDPVLSEALRDRLEHAPGVRRAAPARAEDRALAELHALVRVVRGASRSVTLSAPATDLAGTEREPAALFVDAAAAVARPDAATGAAGPAVPDGHALRRDFYRPARDAAARFRAAHPVSAAAWLDRVARIAPDLPPGWADDPVLGLARLATLDRLGGPAAPGGGTLAGGEPFPALPGLSPEKPISATQLNDLIHCPRMFLMRRVLGWGEPASPPTLRELDARSFGILLHAALEAFYRAHGADLVAGNGTLERFMALAVEAAHQRFEAHLSEIPLVGEGIVRKERERLVEAVRAFVKHDWDGRAGRRFVGVELAFGVPEPIALGAGDETLHVRGYLDRVDVAGDETLVRDVKSGTPHPRTGEEAGPVPEVDVQIGLYALAARRLAPAWGTPERVVAAYVYANGRGDVQERSFGDDPAALEDAARAWLARAARLLRTRTFPPAEDEDACTYCPFRPLCGGER